MKRFTFDEVTDFSDFFSGNNHEVTDAIVEGIKRAVEADDFFEVSLEKGEWPQALSACMTKYEEAERYDDVIEAYELLKKATDIL
jgi:hypothetical protein